MDTGWLKDKLKPRSRWWGRLHYQAYGPRSWVLTFNEGGKGIVWHVIWRVSSWRIHFHMFVYGLILEVGLVRKRNN